MDALKIGFVLFDNVTQLDFTGPLQFLSRLPGAQVVIAARSLAPIATDTPLKLVATHTFDTCPDIDVLVVPGGFGINEAMHDPALMTFVKTQGARAKYVSSVCTGAFILGAAGLLQGKRATTHWAYHDALRKVGATPVKARTVIDGNVVSGGGVTAGIDFALTLMVELGGEVATQCVQLALEYDPSPPFDTGTPDTAPASVLRAVERRYEQSLPAFHEALDKALT